MTAHSEVEKPVSEVLPNLPDIGLSFSERVDERAEIVFVAMPDHADVDLVPGLLTKGCRVLDLSAAFHLQDPSLYPGWYGYKHEAPALLEQAIYGLVECCLPPGWSPVPAVILPLRCLPLRRPSPTASLRQMSSSTRSPASAARAAHSSIAQLQRRK